MAKCAHAKVIKECGADIWKCNRCQAPFVVYNFGEESKFHTTLAIIAGGEIDKFPGAPKLTTETVMSPETILQFKADMWLWSQRVAQAALKTASAQE